MPHLFLLLLSLSVSLPVASIGHYTPAVKAPGCSAVSRAAIAGAIGRSPDQGTREESSLESTCSYSAGDMAVTISIRQLTRPMDVSAELRNLREAFPGATLQELTGIEGGGFALQLPGVGAQLHLFPREREYVLVSVLGMDPGQSLRAAAEIARLLL